MEKMVLDLLGNKIRKVVETNRCVKDRVEKLKDMGFRILVKGETDIYHPVCYPCWEYGFNAFPFDLLSTDLPHKNVHFKHICDTPNDLRQNKPPELAWYYQISGWCKKFNGLVDNDCVYYVEVRNSELLKHTRKFKLDRINLI